LPRIGEKYRQELQKIFGPAGGGVRVSNDVFTLAAKSAAAELPYLWLSCGTEDALLDSNRQFVALLHQRKIPYTYTEAPGEHSWIFWDEELPAMLRELGRHMMLDASR
jgi:S-formylglutathione hydrolase FrmB